MKLLVKIFFMMFSVSTMMSNFSLKADDASGTARLIFEQSGVRGGLIVHLGVGNGRLTAALRANKSFLVHGLEKDPDQLEIAREYIHAQGLYGPVSISAWDGEVLPYAENLVNLIVSEEPGNVSKEEIFRVLAPRGVAIIKQDGIWNKTVKPVPVEIDEWTHYLHGPGNNAVADDMVVGPPQRLQWVNPPLWSRSHEHLANMSAAVMAGGRLVANDDRLYVTPGYGEPVVALDGATGETIREYEQTINTQEIILSDEVLYLVLGHEPPESAESQAARAAQAIQDEKIFQWYLPIYEDKRPRTHIMAVDAVSGKTLWHKTGSEVDQVMPTTLAVAEGKVFLQNPSHVISLDALNGQELWRAPRSINRNRVAWSTPTLVVYDGVVISADRDKGGEGDYINWLIHARGDGDWLTYRHDAARSGSTKEVVPLEGLAPVWQTRLPEPLTAPVKAGDKIFVASVNTHTVYALDASTGEHQWQFTAGSRVDSPPTIWNGRIFFGSADGWVYCLRERDGALVWRHRAAPVDRLIVSDGRLESAWPVHGSVLIQPCPDFSGSATVYAAAGRSGYLDGGIVLTRIDAETGHELSLTPLDSRDPVTGHQPHPLPDSPPGFSMPGILNDVLSAQGENIFMRHNRFDLDGNLQDNTMWHLHSPAGFLDDSWWHRTYWMVGLEMHGGWGGWHAKGPMVPSGRLLVLDDERVYGFGRDRYHRGGSHVGIGEANYRLFARDMSVDPRRAAEEEFLIWTKHVGLFVRGMVLAGNTLFVAGPPDPLKEEDPARVWEGRDGGRLMGIVKGINVFDLELAAPPVFDGLIAAEGSLYMSTTDGNVICFSKKK